MSSRILAVVLAVSYSVSVPCTYGAPPRGGAKGGGERGGAARGGSSPGKSLGGSWSERSHSGPQHSGPGGLQNGAQQRGGQPGVRGENLRGENVKGNNPIRPNSKQPGAEGVAAGAAAVNRNNPQATGKQGAAAGAAIANRNAPNATGAQGAAAGAAAANRNNPQYSGAQGAAAGAALANRNAPQYSGAAGAAAGYAAVRNSAYHPNMYGADWYQDHPNAWTAAGVAAGSAWVPATWNTVAAHVGYGTAAPISYNYGVNVTAQNGNVMVGDQNVGTVAEFGQQAADLAQTGADAEISDDDQWLPLGVYAMVRNENQHPQFIIQLAINKNGILRGNYTDEASDHTLPIQGAVDKTTQRAAWTVGDNKNSVMEAGINDLTGNEAPALIHKNGKTDHWLLVRMEHPAENTSQDADGSNGAGAEK